ncbi:MAG: DoxX family protein [Gemmatimonadaceae bacterium]
MERRNAAKLVAIWVVSAMLSAVFLIVGIPKLIGGESHWVDAFAMMGYPSWLRVLVGLAETVGALCLLIPGTAVFAATVLALLMVGATYAQLTLGNPGGAAIPFMLGILLGLVAWFRRPSAPHQAHPEAYEKARRVIREGLLAGFIGAISVAIWFLIVDMINGRPLFTPMILGKALFSVFGPVPPGENPIVHIAGYTIFHITAFVAVGTLLAVIVAAAQDQPAILAGLLILFVVFEIGFHGLVALLQETTILGSLAWYQVMAGNLIAATGMGLYLWKAHPELRAEFAHALDGTEDEDD